MKAAQMATTEREEVTLYQALVVTSNSMHARRIIERVMKIPHWRISWARLHNKSSGELYYPQHEYVVQFRVNKRVVKARKIAERLSGRESVCDVSDIIEVTKLNYHMRWWDKHGRAI